jgi:hypothetical protein
MVTTRLLNRINGSTEIVLQRGSGAPRQDVNDNPLAFEHSVLWLQPLAGLDFVRVAIVKHAKHAKGPLLCEPPHLLLGYSRLTPDAPRHPATGGYMRRLFYLREEDCQLNMNQFPEGALDPRTIMPGFPGRAPSIGEWERGYPAYMRRAELGLPVPPVTIPSVAT